MRSRLLQIEDLGDGHIRVFDLAQVKTLVYEGPESEWTPLVTDTIVGS